LTQIFKMDSVIDGGEYDENLRVFFGVVGVEVDGLFGFHATHCRIVDAESFLSVRDTNVGCDDDIGSEFFYLFDDFFGVDFVGDTFVD